MKGNRHVAMVVSMFLASLPLVLPAGAHGQDGAVAVAEIGTEAPRFDFVVGGCPLDGSFAATVAVFSRAFTTADVTVTVYRSDGAQHSSSTRAVDPNTSALFALPQKVDGSVLVTSTASAVNAILNHYGKRAPDARGAGNPCIEPLGFGGVSGPVYDSSQPLVVQSVSPSPHDTDVTYRGTDGASVVRDDRIIGSRERWEVAPRQIGGQKLATPGTFIIFDNSFNVFTAYTALAGVNRKEPSEYLPLTDATSADRTVVLPVPVRGGQSSADVFTVQNISGQRQTIDMTARDPAGDLIEARSEKVLAGTNVTGFALASKVAGVATVTVTGEDGGVSASLRYTGGGKARAKGGTGAWQATPAMRAIDESGFAFGAASTRKSKVSIVVFNPGEEEAEVSVRVYDGDTGKQLQTEQVAVDPGATAIVPFGNKVRGENLYVEFELGPLSEIYAWLMRDFKGDLDFYAAIPDRF